MLDSVAPQNQSEHLILLVGGNPLPNAVAGIVLGKQQGQITLIHTQETFAIAQRLEAWFVSKGFKRPILKQAKESEANSMYMAISSAPNQLAGQSVGLNYTGGTKAMAVHAYHAVEAWAESKGITPVFSYLDARTLDMVFDPTHPESGEFAQTVGMELMDKVGLSDLFAIHGWESKSPASSEPFLAETSAALVRVHQVQTSVDTWNRWKQDVLNKHCRRSDRPDKWKSQGELRQISLHWPNEPDLQGMVQALQQELGLSGETLDLEAAARACGKNKIESFCKWLDGGYWLETVTLEAARAIAPTCHLRDVYMSLNPKLPEENIDFELDVVALRGYQLFAFSCGTDSDNKKLKLKLFEAYVRARQLGGDEAQVALVCCSDDPAGLERQIHQSLKTEGRQIKVFGRHHLPGLADELQMWIMTSIQR